MTATPTNPPLLPPPAGQPDCGHPLCFGPGGCILEPPVRPW